MAIGTLSHRPGLLVSVRNASEALAALDGGADVIDIKEPLRGTLGAPDTETVAAVTAAVAGRAPVTVAFGELLEAAELPALSAGVAVAKFGLAGAAGQDWPNAAAAVRSQLPAGVGLALVAYADKEAASAPPPEEILTEAISLGVGWLVLDTWCKEGTASLDLTTAEKLEGLVSAAESAGVSLVLAGSLTPDRFAEAVSMRPALVGVRGAACEGGRAGTVTTTQVRRLAETLAACRQKA